MTNVEYWPGTNHVPFVGLVPSLSSLLPDTVDLGGGMVGTFVDDIGVLDVVSGLRVTEPQYYWGTGRWLTCAQRLPGHRFLYLLAHDAKGKLLGLLPCQYVVDDSTPTFYDLDRVVGSPDAYGGETLLTDAERCEITTLRERIGAGSVYPTLVAAVPNSYCALSLDPSLTGDERVPVVRALVSMLRLAASELRAVATGALYLYPADEPTNGHRLLAAELEAAGLQRVTLGADCVLHVRWNDFDEYAGSFGGRWANVIRRERRDFVQSGLTVTVRRGAEALRHDFVDLYVSLQRKYGATYVDAEKIATTLDIIAASLADEVLVFEATRDGESLGFVLFMAHDGALYARMTGLDHSRLGKRDFCYFNLLYYEPLCWAMSNGMHRLHYGFASYEAKLRRGCRLETAVGYVDPPTAELSAAFRLVSTNATRTIDEARRLWSGEGRS
jgi:hypothetical protein